MSPVSVLLPVTGEPRGLEAALNCIRVQSLREFECLVLLNVAGENATRTVERIAGSDRRFRAVHIDGRGLARALNAGLRAAAHDLVARMDADDWCHPSRLEMQRSFMLAHPDVGVVGTSFECRDTDLPGAGNVICAERPPTDPAEVRWRLLLGNVMCHGSVMMRTNTILAAGGYDETVDRAQDYELWLRLDRSGVRIANLPDVLYRYSTSRTKRDERQARFAAHAMTSAWAELPGADTTIRREIEAQIAESTWGGSGARAALGRVESLLTRTGPTREAMLAWWWCAQRASGRPFCDSAKLERLREAGERIRGSGTDGVWLYGAGTHTNWVLDNADELRLVIRGIIDDTRAGQLVGGFVVTSPSDLASGEHVLISSDAHEEEIWARSAALRSRNIRVWRIYQPETTAHERAA